MLLSLRSLRCEMKFWCVTNNQEKRNITTPLIHQTIQSLFGGVILISTPFNPLQQTFSLILVD